MNIQWVEKGTFASSVDVPVGELNSTCLRIGFNHKSPHFSLKQKHTSTVKVGGDMFPDTQIFSAASKHLP